MHSISTTKRSSYLDRKPTLNTVKRESRNEGDNTIQFPYDRPATEGPHVPTARIQQRRNLLTVRRTTDGRNSGHNSLGHERRRFAASGVPPLTTCVPPNHSISRRDRPFLSRESAKRRRPDRTRAFLLRPRTESRQLPGIRPPPRAPSNAPPPPLHHGAPAQQGPVVHMQASPASRETSTDTPDSILFATNYPTSTTFRSAIGANFPEDNFGQRYWLAQSPRSLKSSLTRSSEKAQHSFVAQANSPPPPCEFPC